MKKTLLALLIIILMLSMVGCASVKDTTDLEQAEETSAIMKQAQDEIGMPNITNFYERKTLKDIYELRDDANLVTYTYTTAMNGKKIFQFESIGYGIPMSVQYSNPQVYKGVVAKQIIDDGGRDWTYDYALVPQPEPNGLFMPEGLSATWVMRVNEDGSREPVYMEEQITVTQTKLPRRLCEEWSLPSNY